MEELIQLVRNWIKRAESDLKTARDEMNTEAPATDAVCFHAQQCAEKYLKAYLTFHQKHFRKTHNIARLIELSKETDQDFDALYQLDADKLTRYAIEVRYAEEYYLVPVEEAGKAIEIADKVKNFVLKKLASKGFEL